MRALAALAALLATALTTRAATQGNGGAEPAPPRVLGAVASGEAGGETLLEAVARARAALTADLAQVVLLRPGRDGAEPLLVSVDLRPMLRDGDTRANVALRDGDLVFVPVGRTARTAVDQALDAALAAGADRAAWLCLRARHGASAGERARALCELCDLPDFGPAELPTLRACLDEAEPVVLREAVTAAGVLGAGARELAGRLRALCAHTDLQVRRRAEVALARVSTGPAR